MDCHSAEELIGRLNEAQNFEHAGSSTRQDERVNDGKHYAGLMSSSSYKEKRAQVSVKEDVKANREAQLTAARAKKHADIDAKDKAEQERDARELARKEKLKRELASAGGMHGEDGAAAADAAQGGNAEAKTGKKRKQKKASGGAALSFDADGEDG